MVEKLLDDLDTYSDLLLSVGTHDPKRPFTPIEVSDLLLRLKNETGNSWKEISKRVGLGKKLKNSTMKKDIDDTQVRLFEKLQNLSRKNVYMIGWGRSKDGKVSMTSACDIAKLNDKDEQDVILNTMIEYQDTEKNLVKGDIKNILDRKIKSPETSISEIIEHVRDIKPIMKMIWKIGITPEDDFLLKFNNIISQKKLSSSKLLNKLIERKFQKNKIKSIVLSKNNLIWITLDEKPFTELEKEWKLKKIPVTSFFNQILMEGIEHE